MNSDEVERKLAALVNELATQEVGDSVRTDRMPYRGQIEHLREYVDVGEYGIAYELIVCLLESLPLRVSGAGAVALIEIALYFGYKTDRPQDSAFDLRRLLNK